MLALNIKLHSINFSKDIIDTNDIIEVTIMTYPDEQKQEKSFEMKKIDSAKVSFKINFVGITEKIAFVFRKKTLFKKSPIIAVAVLQKNNIKIYNQMISFESEKIDLFDSIKQVDSKENGKANKKQKIVGKMEIDFSIKDEFSKENYNISNEIFQKCSKMNSFLVGESINQQRNYFISDNIDD